MRKGISPVVAVVLLIAIAVIAAVAVWYWVSPMTGKPATTDTTSKAVSVSRCFGSSGGGSLYVEVRNTGGVVIPLGTNFVVYYQDNGSRPTGNPIIDFNLSLSSGAIRKYGINATTGTVGITTLNTSTSYFAMYTGIPNANFNC